MPNQKNAADKCLDNFHCEISENYLQALKLLDFRHGRKLFVGFNATHPSIIAGYLNNILIGDTQTVLHVQIPLHLQSLFHSQSSGEF